jgi:hypothetical protein
VALRASFRVSETGRNFLIAFAESIDTARAVSIDRLTKGD